MKRLFAIISILPVILIPCAARAQSMSSYCSAPPYVSRAIPPNVMILMDNSNDMRGPAYTDAYDPTTLTDSNKTPYDGYYNPGGCYVYVSDDPDNPGKPIFKEVLKLDGSVYKNYTASDTCPTTDTGSGAGYLPTKDWTPPFPQSNGPFRGNLLNWATTSNYDILQKVLIGGKTSSRQGNAHTLESISGSWSKTYNNCVFRVNDANLYIEEATPGACRLIDIIDGISTESFASGERAWWQGLVAWFSGRINSIYSYFSNGMEGFFASLSDVWKRLRLVATAWAAPSCDSIQLMSGLSGYVNEPFKIEIKASGCNNCTFTGTLMTKPDWITQTTVYCTTTTTKSCLLTWTGTPTAVGTYDFAASVTSDGGCIFSPSPATTGTKTITIRAATLQINTSALPAGTVGSPYSFTLSGQGGVLSYTWSATGLPSDLSIYSSTGVISGTPTAAGTYSVTVTLRDSDSPQSITSKDYTLVITPPTLSITTSCPLPDAIADPGKALDYQYTVTGSGGTTPYTWELVSGSNPVNTLIPAGGGVGGMFLCPGPGSCVNPPGFSGHTFSPGTIYGDAPNVNNTYTFTLTLKDSSSPQLSVSITCSLTVRQVSGLTILTSSLTDAVKGVPYSFTMQGTGGTDYCWSATGLPACLSMSTGGVISGTCAQADVGPYTVRVTLKNPGCTGATSTDSPKTFILNVVTTATTRSRQYSVKIRFMEEPLNDANGNDIYDGYPETFTDKNNNGKWDGKKGVFQLFWDTINMRAKWGLAMFDQQGNVNIEQCIPAGPISTFLPAIQNAAPDKSTNFPLSKGLKGVVSYFTTATADDSNYKGCTNKPPLDDVACRKNFVLIITSGSNLGSDRLDPLSGCDQSDALVHNACYGYTTDLDGDSTNKKQNIRTYIVSMGTNTANNQVLKTAAEDAGGGTYYPARGVNLGEQLKEAFDDILGQAASGTAVSVLTTSSRGVGSVVQAYFLPTVTKLNMEVWWTGYLQNLWIDPQDNLREDTPASEGGPPDYKLILDKDKVIKLFFNKVDEKTQVALFGTDSQGSGGTLGECKQENVKDFADVNSLWEAGKKLAKRDPGTRKIFTSTKVFRGAALTNTFSGTTGDIPAPSFDTGMTGVLQDALNPDTVTYTAGRIIRYIRGESVENEVPASFRSRLIPVDGTNQVWRLGDIISSTPKVLGNMPLNTYHTEYKDTTYRKYIESDKYVKRTSLVIVGANDGMLHAFRVGYLKETTGPEAGLRALFQNKISDDGTSLLGEEEWAYIPFNSFPYLKYFAMTDYCHLYYNDLPITLLDAAVDGGPTAYWTENSWRTILIGGMRFGGACGGTIDQGAKNPPYKVGTETPLDVGFSAFYALDVTDPEKPVPLWEFSDSRLGYSSALPAIVRTGPTNKNGNWYVVLGSGSQVLPKSSPYGVDIARGDKAHIFFLDLFSGELKKDFDLDHNGIVSDILSIDQTRDYHSEAIYFGTAYKDGTAWKGKLMRVTIPDQDLSSGWTPNVKTLFDDNYPFTAMPTAANDEFGKLWIYAGSGKYYSEIDESDASEQIFIGFKDVYADGNTAQVIKGTSTTLCPADSLCDVTDFKTKGYVGATIKTCAYSETDKKFEFQEIATSVTDGTMPPYTDVGWKIYLRDSQRVISHPLAVGGLVDFLTYKPATQLCAYSGQSFLYSVDYKSGVAPTTVAIRAVGATTDGSGAAKTSGEVVVQKRVELGLGAPPEKEAIIIPPQKENSDKLKKKIQVATGVIVEAENKPSIPTTTRVMHWLKK